MSEATVEISTAMPAAQRMPVWAVVPGDSVFDTFGRVKDTIAEMQVRRVRGSVQPLVWIKLSHGSHHWEPWTFLDEEVTVIPSIAARQTREVPA